MRNLVGEKDMWTDRFSTDWYVIEQRKHILLWKY